MQLNDDGIIVELSLLLFCDFCIMLSGFSLNYCVIVHIAVLNVSTT